MSRLDTVQDIEQAFGLPVKEAAPAAASPTPTSKPADDTRAAFRFISERPTKTIPLKYPFAIGETEFLDYTLRRLSAEEVAEVGQDLRRTGEMASLFSAITGLPFLAVKCMDADDAEDMAKAALDFMPASLKGLVNSPN